MTHEIHYVALGLIAIFIWLRYKSNNGLYGVFAALLVLYLATEYANHNLLLVTILGFSTAYLFYDGLLK